MKCIACLKSRVLNTPSARVGSISVEVNSLADALTVINGDALCPEHALAALMRDDEAVRIRMTGSSS